MTDFYIDLSKLQKALSAIGITASNDLDYLGETAAVYLDELLDAVIEKAQRRQAHSIDLHLLENAKIAESINGPEAQETIINLLRRTPPKPTTKPRPTGELGWYDTADVWIEVGHYSDRGAELRIAFGEALPYGYRDFWIPFSGPDGSALGWMRFGYQATVRGKSLFAGREWRAAGAAAPAEHERLALGIDSTLQGFAPECSAKRADLLEPIDPSVFQAEPAHPQELVDAVRRIVDLIRDAVAESKAYSLQDALWLAFLALNGPAAAACALERYRVITPSK